VCLYEYSVITLYSYGYIGEKDMLDKIGMHLITTPVFLLLLLWVLPTVPQGIGLGTIVVCWIATHYILKMVLSTINNL